MTASTYTTNLADIYAGAGSTTNWSALGGGASGLNAETDYFIQGTGCTTKNAFASAKKGMIYDSGSDQGGTPTDGAYLMWITQTTPNSLATQANGGIDMLIGSSTSAYRHYYVGGSDTIPFLGWILAAVKEQTTGDEADTGSPSSTVESTFGCLFDLPSGGPTKGAPNAIDAIRFGRCDLIYEFGTGADPEANFDLAVADKGDVTDRLGLVQERNGAFFFSGLHQLGTATNAVEFTDSAKTCFWNNHPHVTSAFNTVDIDNASSIINMTNISWKALGADSPGVWTTSADATVNLTTCVFEGWGSFAFDSNTTAFRSTFLSCGKVTANEADLTGCSFLQSTAAADDAALQWDETLSAPRSITELTNTTFEQGTNAHHAITFGTGVDEDITLTGVAFNGFSASDDVNGSTLEFLATSGSLTVNLVNCTVDGAAATTSNIGVDDAAGITVTLSIDPITQKVNVKNEDGDNIQNARVFVETAATITNGEMFEQGVTSLSQVAGTATCITSANHGLVAGDQVVIRGAQPDGYNKVATVGVSAANTFTYTVDSGLSTPATGTPLVSFVAIHGLTDANGDIEQTRTWGAAQQLKGWARKVNASSPFYKQAAIAYTINVTAGNTVNVTLLDDE